MRLSNAKFNDYNNITNKTNKIHPQKIDDPYNSEALMFSPIIEMEQGRKSKQLSASNSKKFSNIESLKKIVGDFTKQAISISGLKRGVTHNMEDEYFKDLNNLKVFDTTGNKNPIIKGLKSLVFINIHILIFFMNVLSIINLVLITDLRLDEINVKSIADLKVSEWIVAGFFCLEVIVSMTTKRGDIKRKLMQIFNFQSITNILLVCEILYSTVWCENFIRNNTFFIFLSVLRPFKLLKLKKIGHIIFKEITKLLKNEKNIIDSIQEQDDIKYFVYNSILELGIGIFIEATFFLSLNESLDYTGYVNNGDGTLKLTYLSACYYMIVSMTSIGYGDIYPVKWQSRLCTICLLFYDISVLSNYIGKMTEHIYKLSPYIRNYSFKNHIVIIGDLPLSFLKYFLKELYQCDYLTTGVYDKNDTIKENTMKKLSKILVIGKETPQKELQLWLEDFSDDYTEAKYLKANVFESIWLKQANIEYARHLFAFSMNPNENSENEFESDKKMAYNIQKIVNNFSNLEITLVLSTDFSNQIKKDSLWSKVNVLSAQIINEYVMGNSIENQGMNVWLTHLATLREKNLLTSNTGEDMNLLKDYANNMGQEIYPIKMPSFFIGKTFQEAVKLTYFSSFDISENYSFDYTRTQISKESLPSRSGLLLIGIEYKDRLIPSITNILVNPTNYEIKKNDIGFVVAFDQASAKILSSFSDKTPEYAIFVKNMNFFRQSNIEGVSERCIENMGVGLEARLKDWKIKKQKYLFKTYSVMADLESKVIEIPSIFNLYEESSPKGIFENHIIVKGNLTRFGKIALVVRTYTERPIILYSDCSVNQSEWLKLREIFRNVYYVYGSPTNIKHVMQLDPKKAFKILILSTSHNNFVQDSESIIFTRIISDFFGLKNFLTEMMEENNLRYISINPKYENNNFFFWPYFVRGSIHFSSVAMSIIAKSIINKTWISFIRNLTKPNNSKNSKIDDNAYQNSKINTLIITDEAAQHFQYFGYLQYALMCNKPSVIAVAILKVDNIDVKRTTLLNPIRKSTSPKMKPINLYSSEMLLKILDNFYGSEYLMTNPSALMPINTGDKVLVIGNVKINNNSEGFFKKEVNSSFILSTPKMKESKPLMSENHFNFFIQPPVIKKSSVGLIKEKISETMITFNRLIKLMLKEKENNQINESESSIIF